MLVRFSFDWGTKVTSEQVETLNAYVDPQIETKPDDNGEFKLGWGTYVGHFEAVASVVSPERLKVSRILDSLEFPQQALFGMMDKLNRGLESLSSQEHLFNTRCEVHVPGLGLLAIDEVTWKEDCCTQELQEFIEAGWRIIAACPQPDQRRPDYVLGRSKNVK